ncbi:MAG: ATP-binding cassette domain-containing protein [Acidobacteriota bacterium]
MGEAGGDPVIAIDGLSYGFGRGALATQVLTDVSLQIAPGEIVILAGPSGSGKTTLLTLIGGLRAASTGSLRVLGRELRGARERDLVRVRRQIGYVFQAHNLLDSLTALRNVRLAMRLRPGVGRGEAVRRAREALDAVGLHDRARHLPPQLSGGQRQRVAIARALVGRPRIVLADEPTASLDGKSGRDVVDILKRLARDQGTAVLLVTHDNRIFDVADRIVYLEDGCLHPFGDAAAAGSRRLLAAFARNNRSGELVRQVRALPPERLPAFLEGATAELQDLLHGLDTSESEAFESLLDQVIEVVTLKIAEALEAERATLFVLDAARQELWSKVAQDHREIRLPLGEGIAGHVARTGETVNARDAYTDPRFNAGVDRASGFRTRSVLCVPMQASDGRVLAVMELLNKVPGPAFGAEDEARLRRLAEQVATPLETWCRTRELGARRRAGEGAAG